MLGRVTQPFSLFGEYSASRAGAQQTALSRPSHNGGGRRTPNGMCLQQLLGPPAWTSARLACASGMTVATTLTWLQSQLCHVSGRSMQPTFVRRQPSEPRCATNHPLRPRVQPPLSRSRPSRTERRLLQRGDARPRLPRQSQREAQPHLARRRGGAALAR